MLFWTKTGAISFHLYGLLSFFLPCIHHTQGKKLNLNNLNHFLTFVLTSNHSVWSPSANLRDMNNQLGHCLTENKPGNRKRLSVRKYFEAQRNGIWGTGNDWTGIARRCKEDFNPDSFTTKKKSIKC